MSDQSPGTETRSHAGSRPLEEIPVLQQKEKLAVEQPTPGFGAAFDALAKTPTVLGEFGAQVALSTAIAQAKIRGNELGNNPHGDILPPVTAFDKAYGEAYSAQAQSVLGLQAQKMMNEGQEALEQSYSINPGMIADYESKMGEGLQEILDNAPSSVKPALQKQFLNNLQSSSHQLNMQMISKNKTLSQQKDAAYSDQQLVGIHDAYLDGNTELAKLTADSVKKNAKANAATGMISPTTADARIQAVDQTILNSQEIAKAIQSRKDNKLAEYLRSLEEKPIGTSWHQAEAARNATLTYMQQRHNFEAQDDQLILSQLRRAKNENTLNQSMLTEAEARLPEAEMNSFYVELFHKTNKETAKSIRVNLLASNASNVEAMSQATADEKKDAFGMLVSKAQQQNPNQDVGVLKTQIAFGAGGEFPSHTKELDALLQNGNAQQVLRAHLSYQYIADSKPGLVASMSNEGKAINSIFKDLYGNGVAAQDAVTSAREQVLNKTSDQQVENNKRTDAYFKTNLKDRSSRESKAVAMMGVNQNWFGRGKVDFPNSAAVTNRIMTVWKSNYNLTNNNESAADELTKKEISHSYGISTVNGQKQVVYAPLEKITRIGEGASSLIKDDVIRNVSPQFEATKIAYDKGQSPFFFRVVSKESNYLNLALEKNELELKSVKDVLAGHRREHITDEIKNLQDGGPIRVEKVWHGATKNAPEIIENLTMQVYANDKAQLTNDPSNPLAGYYDIALFDSKGFPTPLSHVTQGATQVLRYQPDSKRVQSEFVSIGKAGIQMGPSYAERAETFIDESSKGYVFPSNVPSIDFRRSEKMPDLESSIPTVGMIKPGNIDLDNRPVVENTDGTTSTVSTGTFGIEGGKTVLLPTIVNGKRVSGPEAFAHFKETGEHMGIFDSEANADKYDEALHKAKGWIGSKNVWPKPKPSADMPKPGDAPKQLLSWITSLDYAEKENLQPSDSKQLLSWITSLDYAEREQLQKQSLIPSVDISKPEEASKQLLSWITSLDYAEWEQIQKKASKQMKSSITSVDMSKSEKTPESSIPSVDFSKWGNIDKSSITTDNLDSFKTPTAIAHTKKLLKSSLESIFPKVTNPDISKVIDSIKYTASNMFNEVVRVFKELSFKETKKPPRKDLTEDMNDPKFNDLTKEAHKNEALMLKTISDIRNMKGNADSKDNSSMVVNLMNLYPSLDKKAAQQVIFNLYNILKKRSK